MTTIDVTIRTEQPDGAPDEYVSLSVERPTEVQAAAEVIGWMVAKYSRNPMDVRWMSGRVPASARNPDSDPAHAVDPQWITRDEPDPAAEPSEGDGYPPRFDPKNIPWQRPVRDNPQA